MEGDDLDALKWERDRLQDALTAERASMSAARADLAALRKQLAKAAAMLGDLEFSVDTSASTGKDTMACPCCCGGSIVGLPGQHRDRCELAALLKELPPDE